VDLSQVAAPAFIYASREDHIVPWQTAYASSALLGGENRFVLGASGHIAGVVNPPAKRKRHHWVGPLAPDPQAWLGAAQKVDGSWWPAWSDWLHGHAGTLVAPPRKAGSAEWPAIEPAPGRYVKEKAA
jgi:polyhydroxyalkanoate synthase